MQAVKEVVLDCKQYFNIKGAFRMKNLSVVDCIAIAVSWIGVASIAFLAKDVVVAIICIAAAYYLAKWIILKKEVKD